MKCHRVAIAPGVEVGGGGPLLLIAGPCVIESARQCHTLAARLKEIAAAAGMPLVFKASFDKANRSSLASYRGPGMERGLAILAEVKARHGVPILTDIHEAHQAEPAAEVADVLQIPAFLCRQTDLIQAAARTGRVVNLKKGQFLAPDDMGNAVGKAAAAGSRKIVLTERGTSFGYHNLVVDMRSLAVLRRLGWPVVFDATHSVQLPGGAGTHSGGQREFVPVLARAAAAAGIDGLFVEVAVNPARAKSDAANSLPIRELAGLLRQVSAIREAVIRNP
ncbi:MAG TPA: 3-deoxy-8-phosphooctulonate synthase [Planctomycetota bacterium]|nr:3-deoxy-8-phosphooctulonate synthase [Planctomycetota bacterium]